MENIDDVVEKGGVTATKVTQFVLILIACIGAVVGAYFGLVEDIKEQKPLSKAEADSIVAKINTVDTVKASDYVVSDSISVDSISHGE